MMVSDEQDPGPPASDAAWQRLYVVDDTLSSGL
jgi:hypothetical protein